MKYLKRTNDYTNSNTRKRKKKPHKRFIKKIITYIYIIFTMLIKKLID